MAEGAWTPFRPPLGVSLLFPAADDTGRPTLGRRRVGRSVI
jgi:hypothetical protein